MKKDKVIIYDGGFIYYETWNAPVLIDLAGISFNSPVPVTILDGYPVGTACIWLDENDLGQAVLLADVDIAKMDEFDFGDIAAGPHFACDISVKDGHYVQPNTSFDINSKTLTAGNNGAWLITQSELKAVTATANDKPAWKIDNDYEAHGTDVNDTKQPTGAKKMDMETLNQCSQVLQKANKTPSDAPKETYTGEELVAFANMEGNLAVPLIYEDDEGNRHDAGEITLTHVLYGQGKMHGIICETYCWPAQLQGVPVDETTIMLNMADERNDSHIGFKVMFKDDVDRGIGFAPVNVQMFKPLNVTISRKYPAIEPNRMADGHQANEHLSGSQEQIAETCDAIKNLLLEKNRKYGNSALNPVRVFSKADTVEQIKVRMDDKLSRIRNEQGDEDEDVYMDLAGYLVLMLIAKEEQKQQKENGK